MSPDLALDDGQQALADALAAFCRDRCDDAAVRAAAGTFPEALWRELAGLGVLQIGTPEGEGGALELVAAMESLGRAVFPGPLVDTAFAVRVLPEADRRAVGAGEVVASVGVPPELPFAPVAGVFVELAPDGRHAWRARPAGAVAPVATLGGEPWGRVVLEREAELPDVARARGFADAAHAAFQAAAGRRLVDDAAEHARTRRQFGRPIGEFQAVAHPLADAAMATDGAATLARASAFRLDMAGPDDPEAQASAAAARLAADRASLEALRTAHQVFGAVGITMEGPAFHVSRRTRQLAARPGVAPAREAVLDAFVLHPEAP